MRLIIFGAAGATGLELVKQALDAGYDVTAFVRSAPKLTISHPNLSVVVGDALSREDVSNAISGHDAVVSCLGAKGLGPTTVLAEMAANIVEGMKRFEIPRIIYLASAGIYKEIPGIMGFIAHRMMRNVFADHKKAADIIVDSQLKWTIVRPMVLTHNPAKGTYRTAFEGVPNGGRKIARADVAHFLLAATTDDQWVRKSVAIAD
ncbi:MAG: oxidoreductase [Cohnella sp.]|nr:oxidoreductase [Cohnella sp.]